MPFEVHQLGEGCTNENSDLHHFRIQTRLVWQLFPWPLAMSDNSNKWVQECLPIRRKSKGQFIECNVSLVKRWGVGPNYEKVAGTNWAAINFNLHSFSTRYYTVHTQRPLWPKKVRTVWLNFKVSSTSVNQTPYKLHSEHYVISTPQLWRKKVFTK